MSDQTEKIRWIDNVVGCRWFPIIVWVLRLLLGGVFVMSGLVKGIDLWGFVFKIEDYLEVWDMSQPRSLVLMAALLISGYEFVFGLLLAVGCYKRVVVWALAALMAVMLPLSGYVAVENPVSDCGCFGDFWIISNSLTFVKNILITIVLLFLLIFNYRLKIGMFQPAIQWIVGAGVSLYFVFIALYGYNVQPMVDFRPYPVGSVLVEPDANTSYGEEDAENEDADDLDEESAMSFVYERNGERQEFAIDNLPDSTWTFIERIDAHLSSKPTDNTAEFVVYDSDGNNVTADVITGDGAELFLVIPEPQRIDISYTYFLNELKQWCDTSDVKMACLIAADSRGIDYWNDVSMASYGVYSVEDTKLKELVRGTMALVELQDGKVKAKYTMSSIGGDIFNQGLSDQDLLNRMAPKPSVWFKTLTGIFVASLLLLYIFQSLVLAVSARIKRIYQKKALNLQTNSKDSQVGS